MTAQLREPIKLDFVIAWVTANAIGYVVANVVFSWFGWLPLILLGVLASSAIGWLASGALTGTVVGVAQWMVLRRYLRKPARWVLTGTAGWAVASVALWATPVAGVTDVEFVGFQVDATFLRWAFIGTIFGLTSSAMQLLILPLRGRKIGLWLVFNTLGWAFGLAAGWPIALATRALILGPLGCVSGALGGAITGAALLWLLGGTLRLPERTANGAQSEQVVSSNAPFRFTWRDRLGGIGVFGILMGVPLLAAGETAFGAVVLGVSAAMLILAIATRRRN